MMPSSLEAEVLPWVKRLPHRLRAALDKRLRSRVQLNRAVLLADSQKLEPWPLDEGPRPKSGKSRLNLGSKARSNSRTQFASNESILVPKNLNPRPPSK